MNPPVRPGMPEDDRNVVSIYDYVRDQMAQHRKEIDADLDHEKRYRQQYGEMASKAYEALAEKGWVTISLHALEIKMEAMQRGQNRIFITAFSLLITMLTLLLTIIFGVLTR